MDSTLIMDSTLKAPPEQNLDAPADVCLIENMLRGAEKKLDELLAYKYRNRGGLHRKIIDLIIRRLSDVSAGQYTVKGLFLHLLVLELTQLKYYTWGNWAVGPRRVCRLQSLNLIKIMFGTEVPAYIHKRFVAAGDFNCLEDYIRQPGFALLRCLWRYDFDREIKLVEIYQKEETLRSPLPFSSAGNLATVVDKEYAGILNGRLAADLKVVALNEYFLENIELANGFPFRKDSGKAVVFEDFKVYAIVKRDRELLQALYTELLELYIRAAPLVRAAHMEGEPVAFSPKKLMRKMTKNEHSYNLELKLTVQSDTFYNIETVDRTTGTIRITKVFDLVSYNKKMFKINAAFLLGIIDAVERKNPKGHVYYLPMGGKKSGRHIRVVTEHIIAAIKQDRRYFAKLRKKMFGLWEIINQYTQIIQSYDEYESTRSKNIWIKRLTEGLYSSLYAHAAPHYEYFEIQPAIVNSSGKAVNIPTVTTIKTHKIYIIYKNMDPVNTVSVI